MKIKAVVFLFKKSDYRGCVKCALFLMNDGNVKGYRHVVLRLAIPPKSAVMET